MSIDRRQAVRSVFLAGLLTLVASILAGAQARNSSSHLYVLSAIPSPNGGSFTGQVSVVDPTSGHELQSFPAGTAGDIDAVSSPDGSRLYIASDDVPLVAAGVDQDFLTAVDRASERQLWRTEIHNRVKYHDDTLSTLIVSPDGRSLDLYSLYSAAVAPSSNADRSTRRTSPGGSRFSTRRRGRPCPQRFRSPIAGAPPSSLCPG
jgi:hypothetical protein